MSWCYWRVQGYAGGNGEVFTTWVCEIWTSITGFIEDLLTSVHINSTFSGQYGKISISVLNLRLLKLVNDFSYRTYRPGPCMCVTGVTDTPTYGNGVQEKKRGLKNGLKKTIFGRDGLWGDRPSDPFQMALRAALWTIGTSGKALHDCKTTAFNSYRNLVSTEVCTNNKKTVLLSVLLYCPGSTVPGYALSTSIVEPVACVRSCHSVK